MKTLGIFVALVLVGAPACRDDRDRAQQAPPTGPSRSTLDVASRDTAVLEMRAELAFVDGQRRAIAAGAAELAPGSPERTRVENAAAELDSRISQVRTLVDALHAAPADVAQQREAEARRALHELHGASADAWRTLYDATRDRLHGAS